MKGNLTNISESLTMRHVGLSLSALSAGVYFDMKLGHLLIHIWIGFSTVNPEAL